VQGAHSVNAGEIRERVRKMSDEELLRYATLSKSMCSTETNLDKPSLDAWCVQLQEARAEDASQIQSSSPLLKSS
jgi:hypothetical protein